MIEIIQQQIHAGIVLRSYCGCVRFRQDHPMGGYKSIDPIARGWAESRGLHLYTGHKQNDVRSMTVYLWIGARHESTGHIWLDPPNELGLVGVHAAQGSFRFDDAVQPEKLAAALDGLYDRLAANKRHADAF